MNTRGQHTTERRVGILTTDTDLVVKSWDAVLERMTGIPAARALGRPLHALSPDLGERVPLDLLTGPLTSGAVQVLAPALHKFLIPCAPLEQSSEFDRMQQRVVVGPLLDDERAVGLVITIEDVTARLERERQLARRLRQDDPAERIAAIEQLAAVQQADGLGALESALGDEDWTVRRSAVQALAARRDAPLVDAIVAALRDGHHNFSLLSSALQLLSLTGVDVTDALVSLMHNPDADVRIQAALALGGRPRPEAVAALVAALDDVDVNVRFHAIEALGKQAHPMAVERLVAIAASREFFLAFPAIAALVRIGDPLAVPSLAPLLDDRVLAPVAAEAIGRLGDEDAVESLVHALNTFASPPEPIVDALVEIHQRYWTLFSETAAIEDRVGRTISTAGIRLVLDALPRASGDTLKHLVIALSWLNDPAIPAALARVLGSAEVRHELVEAFVRFGASASVCLVQHLQTDDVEAQRSAIVALGRMGDGRAAPPLIEMLADEDERALWVLVCGALARLGDQRAFDALLEKLGDADAAVRQAAIGALNSIGHPAMGRCILSMIDSPNRLVRESAVRIAGYFGYPECTGPVLIRCHDEDETVRAAALEHLPYFDSPHALGVLATALEKDTPRVRAAVAHALGSMPDVQAAQLLTQALYDSEPWVRYFAAIGLGRQGHRPAVRALIRLAESDPAVHVAAAALDALASIGGEAAVNALGTVAVNGGERGLAALRALGRVPSAAAVEILQRALRNSDTAVRVIAVDALAAQGSAEAIGALAWTATADVDVDIARRAIHGLRDVANRRPSAARQAVAALVEMLRDPMRRDEALEALGRLAPSAVPHLTEAAGAADSVVKRRILEAVGRYADPAASATLRRALSDEDPAVRRIAIASLARVGARGLNQRLTSIAQSDPSPGVRQAATAALHRSTTLPVAEGESS
jgi:HEAT repeat protein